MSAIPVIDVFAGPGGLNEGFSAVRDQSGEYVFRTAGSFEMDPVACETLRLRAAVRHLMRDSDQLPRGYYDAVRETGRWTDLVSVLEADPRFRLAYKHASAEVHQIRLGGDTERTSNELIELALAPSGGPEARWVLIGGPPCQAYSLVGRSRRTSDPTFKTDEKHLLYREYLQIIQRFRPTVFVMENVKGMLSSRHDDGHIFERIMSDLQNDGGAIEYDIRSFRTHDVASPKDFVVTAEDHGVPQKRHRVLLLGVRRDAGLGNHTLLRTRPPVSVAQTIGTMPSIRSRVSPRTQDTDSEWLKSWEDAMALAASDFGIGSIPEPLRPTSDWGGGFVAATMSAEPKDLANWLVDPQLGGALHHEGRAHMREDLKRYGYLAVAARQTGRVPRLSELRGDLLPLHHNVKREVAPFADRFKVQLADQPSSTITSHIAKDGHYYIHPDAAQMRSLTVREAARLQTFPDNYYFMGNRTQQYHQVGNAVPPLLARQIGEVVADLMDLVSTSE